MVTTLAGFYEWLREHNWPIEVILHPDDFAEITFRMDPSDRAVPLQIGPTAVWPKALAPALDVSENRIFGKPA